MRRRRVLAAWTALAGVLAGVGLGGAPATADTGAAPPLVLDLVDYRYAPIDGSIWLEYRALGVWCRLAPAPAVPERLAHFHGGLFVGDGGTDPADATSGRLLRLNDGEFDLVAGAPAGVLDDFVYGGSLYVTTADGWWSSADGVTWSAIPGSPQGGVELAQFGDAVVALVPATGSAPASVDRFDGTAFTPVPDLSPSLSSPVAAASALWFVQPGSTLLQRWDGSAVTTVGDPALNVHLGPVALGDHVYVGAHPVGGADQLYRVVGGSLLPVPGGPSAITSLASADGELWTQSAGAAGWTTWREPPEVAGSVTVLGRARVGSPLSATLREWPIDAALDYQWLRDGRPVAGATRAWYAVAARDRGHGLSVRVLGTPITGGAAFTAESGRVAVPGEVLSIPPTVHGHPRVGAVLTAWTAVRPPGGTVLHYRWRRNGHPIRGAKHRTYRLTTADRGCTITVTVTAVTVTPASGRHPS